MLGDGGGGSLHQDGELLQGVDGARDGLAGHDDGNLNVDLLAGLDGLEVGVQNVAAHGVNLNVLDEGQLGLAVDLQLNERVLVATDDQEQIVTGNVEVTRLFAVAVEDRGNLAGAAGAAGGTLTELGTLFGKQDGVVAHVFSFVSQVRRRCRQSEGGAARINSGPVDNGGYGSALAGATPTGYLTTRADVKRESVS